MKVRRVLGGLWLLLAACLHLFGNSRGTLTILVLSLLYALIAPVMVAFAARSLRAEMLVAPAVDGSAKGTLAISMRFAFFCRAECSVSVNNLWTGESRERSLNPNASGRCLFEARARHCGVIEITLDAFRVSDPLRLFARRLSKRLCKRRLVRPALFELGVSFRGDPEGAADAWGYSKARAGVDPGETRAIREYRAGDSLNSIHWKLSEKADRLLTREFSQPAAHRVLLALTANRPEPERANALAEHGLSLSLALAREGIPHALVWLDEARGEPVHLLVDKEEEVEGAMARLLSAPLGETRLSIDEILAYAHTILVCDEPPLDRIPGRVTVLSPEEGARPECIWVE